MFLDVLWLVLGKIVFFTGMIGGKNSFPKPLSKEEEERCLLLAEAINAIEGLAISTELEQQLEKWKNGEIAFYQVFEDALKKYGFPI